MIIPHSPRRFQAGIAVFGGWRKASFSGRAARKGCHWKVGCQDTHDTQDTQESAVREWSCASHWPITGEWQALRTGHSFMGVLGVLGVLARRYPRTAVSRLSSEFPAPPMRRQDGGVPSQWQCSMRSRRSARYPAAQAGYSQMPPWAIEPTFFTKRRR